jgi:acyl dehydratase
VAFAGLTGDYSSSTRARSTARRASSGAASRTACWASPTRTASCGRAPASSRDGDRVPRHRDWRFVGPIFLGDTIFVNYRIAELRDSQSKADAGDRDVRRRGRQPGRRGRAARQEGLLVSKVPLRGVEASKR